MLDFDHDLFAGLQPSAMDLADRGRRQRHVLEVIEQLVDVLSQFRLDRGPYDVRFVGVSDSDASSGALVDAYESYTYGNTENWAFHN